MPKPEYRTEEDERTFNLVDQHTVDRLRRTGDVTLPPKKVSIPEDKKWNTKTFNSVLIQSINEGSNMKTVSGRLFPEIMSKTDLAGKSEKEIAGIIKKNEQSAMRNARTMITYAENAGRLDSYKDLQAQGIVMRKQWMATPDDRTRESHIDIDGEEVEVEEKFSNGCECPGDPGGPPEEVWNCRCTMVARIVGFKAKDGSVVEVGRPDSTMHDRQIEEERDRRAEDWERKMEKREKRAEKDAEKPAEEQKGYADRIKEIKDRIGDGKPTEADVMEAGEIFKEEYDKRMEDVKKQIEELKQKSDELKKQINDEWDKHFKLHDQITGDAYKEADRIRRGLLSPEDSYFFQSREEALAFHDKVNQLLREEDARFHGIVDALREQRNQLLAQMDTLKMETLPQVLSDVRPLGIDAKTIKDAGFFMKGSKKKANEAITSALGKYPTDWGKATIQKPITTKTTSRGYYSHWRAEMSISGHSEKGMLETAVHELGHKFERDIPGLLDAEKAFYDRRTAGEDLKWLGRPYGKEEKSRKDNFFSAYIGKDYGGTAYEVCSMGFEAAYTDPTLLAGDPDMQKFIFGCLCLY